MRILIAEDDPVSRRVLEVTLLRWGHELTVVADGATALATLTQADAPPLAVLDWMMPGLDGADICRQVRQLAHAASTYIILLTARGEKADLIAGLESGADDYLIKPFDPDELRARLQVGLRVVELQQSLAARVRELESALANVKQLQGLLPICSYCKSIRDDQNYWQRVESYVTEHTEARFSHSICPDCYATHVEPHLENLRQRHNKGVE